MLVQPSAIFLWYTIAELDVQGDDPYFVEVAKRYHIIMLNIWGGENLHDLSTIKEWYHFFHQCFRGLSFCR
jgi:hypothetical protein